MEKWAKNVSANYFSISFCCYVFIGVDITDVRMFRLGNTKHNCKEVAASESSW